MDVEALQGFEEPAVAPAGFGGAVFQCISSLAWLALKSLCLGAGPEGLSPPRWAARRGAIVLASATWKRF